jgi:hypothetical protein
VLLDAGAGAAWRYRDAATGAELGRSEGLGVASLRMWQSGALDDLSSVDATGVGHAFQVSPDNPLVGVEGRAELLRRVGEAVGYSLRRSKCGCANTPRPRRPRFHRYSVLRANTHQPSGKMAGLFSPRFPAR